MELCTQSRCSVSHAVSVCLLRNTVPEAVDSSATLYLTDDIAAEFRLTMLLSNPSPVKLCIAVINWCRATKCCVTYISLIK